jgi:ParB/RepB/Spo0J family partition protein
MKDFSAKDYLSSGRHDTPRGEHSMQIPITEIEPNPYQPRKTYDQQALDELTQSIREKGVIEPVIVRLNPSVESAYRYQLAAGERRLRASRAAGLTHIPGLIREMSDIDMRDVGLIENVQREDLNAFDTMNAYADLCTVHGTAEAIATRIGKHKRTIEKYLKIHAGLTSIPEANEVFVKHATSVTFPMLADFAGVSARLRRLAKADKREFARAIKAIDKNPKAGIQRLVRKFDDKGQRETVASVAPAILTETDKALAFSVRLDKAALSPETIQEIKAKIDAFCARLDSLWSSGKEEK